MTNAREGVKRYEPCFHRSADEGIREVRNGSLVLYTDYAALRTECMEQARLLGMSGSREAALLSERDTLRAQLEAAEGARKLAFEQGSEFLERATKAEAQLEAATADAKRLRAFVESMVSALGPYPFLNGHGIVADAYEVLAAHITPQALSAAPDREDGVREAVDELLAKQNSKIAKARTALEALCGEDPQSEFDEGYCPHCGVRVGNSLPCHDKDHAKGCAFIKGRKALKALAAPAPAREDGACYQCKCVDCGGVFNSQNKRAVVCPSCQVSAADCWRKAFEIARSYNELGNVVSHEDDEEIKRLVAQAQALAAPASSGQPEGGIWIECPRCTGEYADNGCPACEGVGKLKGKALAAPAPAVEAECSDCGKYHGLEPCEKAPAPARCICSDGGPQSYEGPLRDCPIHGENAPAPARVGVIQLWGAEVKDASGKFKMSENIIVALNAPAPAKVCQTCGGKREVSVKYTRGGVPCPDCAHEEGKK